ncbi:prevent-host-death family protein [Bifidobacterium tsurumiense]|uniref:prevent-host-death family protein n=1 Tax=Bifidobacterium tsurumiense TaxID=356829 RepID=UPI0012B23348|nr:prevent-host-death family protein [Bifidobacterium tsurumiense]MDY4678399.1 prevent-host-death family protein [Bifidobacterium tsurumiense]MSS12622.1 prevent-host-death family protein [Bifidobacterium tsurumiense]
MQLTIPVETMVPISKFSRGTASAEFAKVADNTPVTVMKNNQPAYFILNEHDYRHFREIEAELEEMKNAEARRQARNSDYDNVFDDTKDFMTYVDNL